MDLGYGRLGSLYQNHTLCLLESPVIILMYYTKYTGRWRCSCRWTVMLPHSIL